jgi:hypothetical protein
VDVHLAEERFVADGPLFRRRHDGSLQRYSCTPRLSRLRTGRHHDGSKPIAIVTRPLRFASTIGKEKK